LRNLIGDDAEFELVQVRRPCRRTRQQRGGRNPTDKFSSLHLDGHKMPAD
jgi:hypothetical protein